MGGAQVRHHQKLLHWNCPWKLDWKPLDGWGILGGSLQRISMWSIWPGSNLCANMCTIGSYMTQMGNYCFIYNLLCIQKASNTYVVLTTEPSSCRCPILEGAESSQPCRACPDCVVCATLHSLCTLISEVTKFLLIAVPLQYWDFAYNVSIRVLLTWFLI